MLYSFFVLEHSAVVPFTDPTKGVPKSNKPVKYEEKHEKCFDTLKNALCSAPMLALRNKNFETIVEIDVPAIAIGDVLSQKNERREKHPTALEPPDKHFVYIFLINYYGNESLVVIAYYDMFIYLFTFNVTTGNWR